MIVQISVLLAGYGLVGLLVGGVVGRRAVPSYKDWLKRYNALYHSDKERARIRTSPVTLGIWAAIGWPIVVIWAIAQAISLAFEYVVYSDLVVKTVRRVFTGTTEKVSV